MSPALAPVRYCSTNGLSPAVNFEEALLKGLAPDGGLYMPDRIPAFGTDNLETLSGKSFVEIAAEVASRFLRGEIDEEILYSLIHDAYNFEVPLEPVFGSRYILRLDRGPTASFKDFAARLMGRLMQYFLDKQGRQMLILTATSGDTGSAIANAFYGLSNIHVVILFPEKEVTDRQRKQMTTLRKNISVLSLNGKFDDCQSLVKIAFTDKSLSHLPLSSANSINIGRLLPQSFYYFYAWSRLNNPSTRVIFSVPSGNFGNLMGGMIARQMGLPVKKFIISTNANNEVPEYMSSGLYNPIVPSLNCASSAMNVGHPSNLARIISLYGGHMDEKGTILRQPDLNRFRTENYGVSVSDETTRETMRWLHDTHNTLTEPHGAVAWAGLQDYLAHFPSDDGPHMPAIVLETAHPAKFPEEIRRVTGLEPELPNSLRGLDDLPEFAEPIENEYPVFRQYLLRNL